MRRFFEMLMAVVEPITPGVDLDHSRPGQHRGRWSFYGPITREPWHADVDALSWADRMHPKAMRISFRFVQGTDRLQAILNNTAALANVDGEFVDLMNTTKGYSHHLEQASFCNSSKKLPAIQFVSPGLWSAANLESASCDGQHEIAQQLKAASVSTKTLWQSLGRIRTHPALTNDQARMSKNCALVEADKGPLCIVDMFHWAQPEHGTGPTAISLEQLLPGDGYHFDYDVARMLVDLFFSTICV